jgi:hypothetical protein
MLIGCHVLNPKSALPNPQRKGLIPFTEEDHGGLLSSDRNELYFIGIIDVLTVYNTKKRVEHCVKSVLYGDEISCIPPR